MEESTGPGFIASAGVIGILTLLTGFAVLVTGLGLAAKRGSRSHALAVFAAAWLVVPLALAGRSFGEWRAMEEIIQLGPAVTPKDLAYGLKTAAAVTACATFGLLLGLVGSVAALARSREETPQAA